MIAIPPKPGEEWATLFVRYPRSRGEVVLRGNSPPLDWEKDTLPESADEDVSAFRVPVPPGKTVEVKPFRTGGRSPDSAPGKWATGSNLILAARDVIEVAPTFERDTGPLLPWHEVAIPNADSMWIRVMLPPSYDEHNTTRYPVIYAMDGQALWSDQHDPFGVWNLNLALDDLWRLGVTQDFILVSIHTGGERLSKLGPVPDAHYGGGQGEAFLKSIVDVLVPCIDKSYRTQATREGRALLGSSMGGLFSFFGAWTRSDVFGNAICLSSSFWWADRWLVQRVQEGGCPFPRPRLYLDSGATASPFEEDANLRDGHHHTRAMMRALLEHCYESEDDLHVLAFPGHLHGASSWGARISIPLQLLFPRVG